jgi:hypothetical protein
MVVVFDSSKEEMLVQRSSWFWILGAEAGDRVLRGFVDFLEIGRFWYFCVVLCWGVF